MLYDSYRPLKLVQIYTRPSIGQSWTRRAYRYLSLSWDSFKCSFCTLDIHAEEQGTRSSLSVFLDTATDTRFYVLRMPGRRLYTTKLTPELLMITLSATEE